MSYEVSYNSEFDYWFVTYNKGEPVRSFKSHSRSECIQFIQHLELVDLLTEIRDELRTLNNCKLQQKYTYPGVV